MPGNRPTGDTADLRFPVRSGPPPKDLPATVEMILAASEEFLPVWNADPGREERRLRAKCRVPFVLAEDEAAADPEGEFPKRNR